MSSTAGTTVPSTQHNSHWVSRLSMLVLLALLLAIIGYFINAAQPTTVHATPASCAGITCDGLFPQNVKSCPQGMWINSNAPTLLVDSRQQIVGSLRLYQSTKAGCQAVWAAIHTLVPFRGQFTLSIARLGTDRTASVSSVYTKGCAANALCSGKMVGYGGVIKGCAVVLVLWQDNDGVSHTTTLQPFCGE